MKQLSLFGVAATEGTAADVAATAAIIAKMSRRDDPATSVVSAETTVRKGTAADKATSEFEAMRQSAVTVAATTLARKRRPRRSTTTKGIDA